MIVEFAVALLTLLLLSWRIKRMSFLKRWFGGYFDKEDDTAQDTVEQEQRSSTQHRRKVTQERRPQEPVLREADPGEEGGVQGLGWYQQSMQRDEDGDVAHEFLEENARIKREGISPEHKRQKASLLCCEKQLKPAGPSDMLVDRGNVYVVPRDDAS